MRTVFPVAWRNLVLCLCSVLLFSACTNPAASEPTNDNLQISLIPAPAANAGETLTVALTDAAGDPITDATVALEGNMNHAGMVPVIAEGVTDEADGSVDGRYVVPFGFTMLGDWIITVSVTQADGTTVSRNLELQVSEGSVSGEAVAAASEMDRGDAADDVADDEHGASEVMDDEPSGDIHVHDQRARPAPLAGGTAAVYFNLHNGIDTPITFIGGETPAASEIQIHETIDDDGVMRMRPLTEGIALPPATSIDLMPGGIHLMLVDLVEPLEVGDTIDLTLHFDGADDLTLSVPVVTIEESMQGMEEAEHDHSN